MPGDVAANYIMRQSLPQVYCIHEVVLHQSHEMGHEVELAVVSLYAGLSRLD